jgi:hypothetical protein
MQKANFTISIGEDGNHRVSLPYKEPIIEGTSVRVYTTVEIPLDEVRLVVSLGVSEEANKILSRYL